MSKAYDDGGTLALRSLDLAVEPGETVVLLGSSGSGKTTALKLINRIIEPSSGSIRLGGRDVREYDAVELRRSIGYVFQGIGLFPHLTVRQNTTIVPRLAGVSGEERAEVAERLLAMVGLPADEYGDRYPDALSGGQQQRVGVARALALDPDYLLMDEPFGALDAVTRSTLQDELVELRRRLRKTLVFVTHDLFEALRIGDRIAVLHEGALHQVGTPEELGHQPATPYVRELFSHLGTQLRQGLELMDPPGSG